MYLKESLVQSKKMIVFQKGKMWVGIPPEESGISLGKPQKAR